MTPERQVACPACRGPSLFSPRNPWRPFCSERCRAIDLGAWASEGYRMESQVLPEDTVDDESSAPPSPPH